MGTKDKLIERFKRQPNDFTWDELVRLFYTQAASWKYRKEIRYEASL